MKKIFLLSLVFLLAGCTTVQIPNYVPNKHPVSKRYYAEFDVALKAVEKTLADTGWQVEAKADPSVYEANRSPLDGEKQILLFSKIRQTRAFLGSRYGRLNVFLSTRKGISEIEIRYLNVTATPVKVFQNYRNNAAVDRLFKHLSELLQAE